MSAIEEPCLREVQVRRLNDGDEFRDGNGQVFVREGKVINGRGETRYQVRCLESPYKKAPGPISRAFFCAVGDVVFLTGNRPVLITERRAA